MAKYVLKRLLSAILTLSIVLTVVFVLVRQMPIEGYFDNFDKLDENIIEAKLEKMGLNDPMPVQLVNFFKNVLKGDLGTSARYSVDAPIAGIIAQKAPVSALIGISSMILALALGLPLGSAMARSKSRFWDKFGTAFIVFVNAVPAAVYYIYLQSYGAKALHVPMLFDMDNISADAAPDWYAPLLGRIFPYTKKSYTIMKALVQESASGLPYTDSLMLCLLTEIIIRLLQGEYTSTAKPASVVRQNYQDELFEKIISYVESKLYEPLTIAEICQQFSLSRSSLQLLFKNSVNQSPKKYISDMKLEKSCQMLRENKYTVSEIASRLGYSSIHYFSNAFNQKYHISPSEYAKRIY